MRMAPSYQIYGEDSALTIKAILPEFRLLGSSTLVLDGKRKGRLLLEWVPRDPSGTNRLRQISLKHEALIRTE